MEIQDGGDSLFAIGSPQDLFIFPFQAPRAPPHIHWSPLNPSAVLGLPQPGPFAPSEPLSTPMRLLMCSRGLGLPPGPRSTPLLASLHPPFKPHCTQKPTAGLHRGWWRALGHSPTTGLLHLPCSCLRIALVHSGPLLRPSLHPRPLCGTSSTLRNPTRLGAWPPRLYNTTLVPSALLYRCLLCPRAFCCSPSLLGSPLVP